MMDRLEEQKTVPVVEDHTHRLEKVWRTPEQKSWLEVEMDETCTLLRKKLEKINDEDVDRIDRHDVWEIKNIYKTLWYIKQLRMM